MGGREKTGWRRREERKKADRGARGGGLLQAAPLAVHGLRRELTLVVELAGKAEGGGKVVLGDAAVGCFTHAVEGRKG